MIKSLMNNYAYNMIREKVWSVSTKLSEGDNIKQVWDQIAVVTEQQTKLIQAQDEIKQAQDKIKRANAEIDIARKEIANIEGSVVKGNIEYIFDNYEKCTKLFTVVFLCILLYSVVILFFTKFDVNWKNLLNTIDSCIKWAQNSSPSKLNCTIIESKENSIIMECFRFNKS
mmetsp:Transcript_751/g.1165  ORF Transcript_751/g.1165 Transcript_751/m.1165 type:complete len:171 (-) Transcript_751:6-518(-)